MKNVKRGAILTVLLVTMILIAVFLSFVVPRIIHNDRSAASVIEVLSYDSRVFFVPEGKEDRRFAVKAELRLNDGSVQNSAQALHFASSDEVLSIDADGNMVVASDIFGADADFDSRAVTVTISCDVKDIEPKTVIVSVVPYPQYKITLDANGGNVDKQTVDAWEGQSVDDPNTDAVETLPPATLGDSWTFDGWYRILEDGTLDSEKFNESDKYYWGKDISLRARFSAPLIIDDDMGARQTLDHKIYYRESIPDADLLPSLSPKNGWDFAGWYTAQGGEGLPYGDSAAQDIYSSAYPVLYAKWTCDNVKCVNDITDSQKSVGKVVYNSAFRFDNMDFGAGELAYWYVEDGSGNETKLGNGDRYTLPADATLHAKVKFAINLNWQNAPHADDDGYYIYYGDSLSSMGKTLPTPFLNGDGIDSDGWRFGGWYEDASTYARKFDEDTVFEGDAALNLYALRNSDFTLYDQLSLDADSDAVVLDAKGKKVSVIYGEDLALGADPHLTSDWAFQGYFTNSDGTGESVTSCADYVGKGSRELYAKWNTTVTLDNPEMLETDTKFASSFTVTYNADIAEENLPSQVKYKKDGRFSGWFTKPYGDGEQVQAGDKYLFTSKITLYSKVLFAISIDYQEADDLDGGGTEYTVVFGKSLKESVEGYLGGARPKKSTWTFDGYYYGDKDQNETKYELDTQKFEFDEDLKLYIRWKGTLTAHGVIPTAFAGDDNVQTQTMYFNRPLPVAGLIAQNRKIDGWSFDGWSKSAAYEEDNEVGGEAYKDGGSVHVYAIWKGTIKFALTLGDSSFGDQPQQKEILYNTAPGELPTPVRNDVDSATGYKFDGWYDVAFDEKNTNTLGNKLDGSKPYTSAAGVTFYEGAKFTVTFNTNGSNDSVSPIEVFYNKKVSVSLEADGTELKKIEKYDSGNNKWQFGGWYYNETETNEDFVYVLAQDVSVEARWEAKVTLYLNSGNWEKMDLDEYVQIDVIEGNTLEDNMQNVPNNWGSWSIKGWYRDSALTDKNEYDIKTSLNEAILTLYPKWTVKKVQLHFLNDTAEPDAPETIGEVVYGQVLPENLPTSYGTRTGYVAAKEWYSSEKYERDSLITNETTVYPKTFTDLYLKWEPKTYTVTLKDYKNLGENITVQAVYGQKMPTIDAPTYHKSGEVFLSYRYNGEIYYNVEETDSAGMPIKISGSGCKEWDIDGDVELEPYYTTVLIKIILKEFYADGSDYILNDSVSARLSDFDNIPYKEGYTFKGYFSKGIMYYDGNMKYVKEGDLVPDEKNVLTLYPTYEVNKYTLTRQNGNQGDHCKIKYSYAVGSEKYSGDDISPELKDIPYGTEVTLNINTSDHNTKVESLKTAGGAEVKYTVSEGNKKYVFKFPADNVIIKVRCDSDHTCVTPDAMITLADGTQKRVDELTGDEMLLVWNIYTGQFDAAPILFVDNDSEELFEVIRLHFSDGTEVKVIGEHGFWDYDLNEWVFLRNDAAKYIGHWFNKQATDGDGNMINQKVQLVDVTISKELTTAWSPVTFGHLCYYVNGMLSMPGATEGFINIFDVDPQTLKVDEEKMAADIEKYGLFTYDDFAEYIPEEVYYAFNGQYLKVAMGKGLLTWESLFALIERYEKFWSALE